MFYHLLYPLRVYFSPLNVFGYISFRSIAAIITSLMLSLFVGRRMIAYLKNIQAIQIIRSDGPASHHAKSGTPTMGGLIVLFNLAVSTLLWARLDNRFILMCIACVLWLGLLGFLDDYFKIMKKNPKGILPKWKIAGQVVFALGVGIYLYFFPANYGYPTSVNVPYLKDVFVEMGVLYILFCVLVIVASSNAVNLTDGLDGLAIGNLIICAFTYGLLAYIAGHSGLSQYLRILPVSGAGELTVLLSSMIGAGLGFLWFNGYPADVFMGDTGSLFLGGVIGLVAIFTRQEFILVVVGGVFVIEALSVILQVFHFKRYRTRIFKMAPLHHHFELSGWAEPKVTVRFWIIGIVLSLIALSSLKIR
ncbi:MAG: phospho-N-acetylmuramoyl-pentapeptide-transferase [Elusimicrobiota bacterium]